VFKAGKTSRYSVIIAPPQNDSTTDKTLMYLDVFYEVEGESEGLIVFNKATTDYSVMLPPDEDGAKLFVDYILPSSSKAATAVTYGTDASAVTLSAKQKVDPPKQNRRRKSFSSR
jgi:hypothetical protein